MKYKKTTITGAALALALVLAVTVAFASNPKNAPNGDTATHPVYDDVRYSGLFVGSAEAEADYFQYDPNDPDSNVLEEYTALLERVVAQGDRTQEEADAMLANMEALIERANNGEIEGLMFYKQASGEVAYVE